MRILCPLVLPWIVLTTLCVAPSCRYQPDDSLKIRRISDRVVVYEYVNVNVTAVRSNNGILVIDTHRSPATMNKIRQLIEKEFGRTDFVYVINTHGDYDHCSGNQIFPSATIIGHRNCPEFMQQIPANSPQIASYHRSHITEIKESLDESQGKDQAGLRAEIDIWTRMLESNENEYRVTPPTKTFSDSLILHLDDMTVQLIYCGNAHTDNDIFIYIPEEKLVFTGDIFTSKSSFGFAVNKMNDVQQVIRSMDHCIEHPSGVEFVVPGHGECLSGKDFRALRDLLVEKYEKIRGKLSGAVLLDSLIERNGIDRARQIFSDRKTTEKAGYYFLEEEFSILGRRLLGKGMINEAIVVFMLSTKAFPNSALGYDNLGAAYLRKGEIDSAAANYERSLRIFPENRNTRAILKMIGHSR